MAYESLDAEYIRRVHSKETLVAIDSQARAIIANQTRLKVPRQIGHSIFLIGCFIATDTIDVQPWAVGENAAYDAGRGRHYLGIDELQQMHLSDGNNIRLGKTKNAQELTDLALTGYYWPENDKIITVFDERHFSLEGDSPVEKSIRAVLERSKFGGVLHDHELYTGTQSL